MFLVYIDESGENRFNDEENYVLNGIIINETEWKSAHLKILQLKNNFFSEAVTDKHEFHMEEIINKKGAYKIYDLATRMKLIKDLFDEISNMNLWAVSVILKKGKIRRRDDFDLQLWSYRYLHERLCWYMKELNKPILENNDCGQYAMMIIDSQDGAHDGTQDRILRGKIRENLINGTLYIPQNEYIIEDPLFTYSNWRSISQISDCVAYVVNKHFQERKHKKEEIKTTLEYAFDRIKDKYLRHPRFNTSSGYSLKIWP